MLKNMDRTRTGAYSQIKKETDSFDKVLPLINEAFSVAFILMRCDNI